MLRRWLRSGAGVGVAMVLTALAMAAAAQAQPAATAPPVTVEATLKAMSALPALKDLGTYNESLTACVWEVVKTVNGPAVQGRIVVYHWSFVARAPQPIHQWKPGQKAVLKLRPFTSVPQLANLRKDEDAVADHLDLPLYYDLAQGDPLPPALMQSGKSDALYEKARNALAGRAATLRFVGVGDCRVADGFDTRVFYGGTGKDAGLNFGDAGSGIADQEMRLRLVAAVCPKLEWAFWGGGPSRLTGVPEDLIAAQPWPAIPGRAPAATSGPIQLYFAPGIDRAPNRGGAGWAMSVERWALIENCVREYNRRGLKFMNGLILTANAGSTSRIDGYPAQTIPIIYERYRSIGRIYPNYCFIERMDIGQSWGLKIKKITPTHILEEWRVKHDAKGVPPTLMPWRADPADLAPDANEVAQAVASAKTGKGDLVVGGRWIAQVMAGKGNVAAVRQGGIPEAELALRTAVAAGNVPPRVVWCIEPLMLTAPRTERVISALPGAVWPAAATRAKTDLAPAQPVPIRLGYGTTVARGKGVWEFGLENYLLFEVALRECERRGIPVLLVLAPNDVAIPDTAYAGLADRLRVLSLHYAPTVRFVDPADLKGKEGPAAAAVIASYLSDTKKGTMVATVPPPGQ